MRSKGSARFAPYFKVQEYDPRTCAWLDVQRAHPTLEAARAAYRPGVRCRVMEITERGRRPCLHSHPGYLGSTCNSSRYRCQERACWRAKKTGRPTSVGP